MATPSPVRLLIADQSENRAHELDSVLRNAGIPTRAAFCKSLDDEALAGQAVDLILCHAGFDHLERVLPGLRSRKPEVPIIVMDASEEPRNLTRGLAMGATDVVFQNDNERLLYVVKREIDNVCQRRRFSQTHRALQEAERRCELLMANSSTAIAYVHEGMHIYANDDYFKLFGFDGADDLLGLTLLDLMEPSFTDEFKAKMRTFRTDSSDELTFEFQGRTTTGQPISGRITLTGAEYEGEHCTQVLVRPNAPAIDPALIEPPILLEKDDAASLGNRNGASSGTPNGSPNGSPTGPLNGSANGAAVDDPFAATDAFIAEIDNGDEQPAAVLVVEIDDFDGLQADFGFHRAELAVRQLREVLTAELGGSRCVRIANHRFGIAVYGASQAGGDVIAERLREVVQDALLELDGKTVRRTITIGAAPNTGASAAESMNLAFRTLLAARANGKTNYTQWPSAATLKAGAAGDDALNGEQRRILKLVNDAIENQSFVLLFQPTISLRGDADEHYEVFLRLLDEKKRRMPPNEFLDLAIDNGVAGKIDRWVILQSIKTLSAHRANGHNTRLTINLTRNSLIDHEFAQWLGVAIKAARLPSDAVVFQIAEGDVASHVRQAREFVQGLKAMHCRTSLSHFGSIENPFETLRHVPVDFVKLDGSHVRLLDGNPERREALTEMIKELQQHGKLTVIPMVESATVLSALWQAGANYIQGHYLQEPSPEMNYDFAADD
jgi:multidomain signaling protein FimX